MQKPPPGFPLTPFRPLTNPPDLEERHKPPELPGPRRTIALHSRLGSTPRAVAVSSPNAEPFSTSALIPTSSRSFHETDTAAQVRQIGSQTL